MRHLLYIFIIAIGLSCFHSIFGQSTDLFKQDLPCGSSIITCMVTDTEGTVWMGTGKGLVHNASGQNQLECLPAIQQRINHIAVDAENNKWLVGAGGTILKVNANGILANENWSIQSHLNSLQAITGIFSRGNQIWLGTSHGFVIHLNTVNGQTDIIETPIGGDIYSVYADTEERIYLGTNEGLFYQDKRKKRWLEDHDLLTFSKFELPGGQSKRLKTYYTVDLSQVYQLIEKDNILWILGKSDSEREFKLIQWTDYSWTAYTLDCLTDIPNSIYTDKSGTVWVSSRNEVIEYQLFGSKCHRIVSKQNQGLANINGIVKNDNTLFVSSLNKGLYHQELSNSSSTKTTPVPAPITKRSTSNSDLEGYAYNNLVFLLDVSNSMNTENKLLRLKKGMDFLIYRLRREDQIAFVTYAGKAKLALPPTAGNRKDILVNSVEGLKTGGKTNILDGMDLAYQTAERFFIEGGNNKIILATDGDFEEKEIKKIIQLIKKNNRNEVSLSILYFDQSEQPLNAESLRKLAIFGGGNYVFIDNDNVEESLLEEAKK